MVSIKTIMLSVSLAAVSISAPAMAEFKTRIVQHDDLDLSTQKGQQRLALRVKIAVDQVCAGTLAYTLREKLDLARCQRDAMARAQPQAARALAAYQNGKRLASGQTAIVGN